MFSWHPRVTLSSGTAGQESRRFTLNVTTGGGKKPPQIQGLKLHLLQGMFPLAESTEPAQMIQNILLNEILR